MKKNTHTHTSTRVSKPIGCWCDGREPARFLAKSLPIVVPSFASAIPLWILHLIDYWLLQLRATFWYWPHRFMPLGERHFDWLVQLSWSETLQLLCWLGVLIRAKLFGLRICYSDIEQSLDSLNVPVTAQRGVPYRGPLVRPDRPPTPLPPAVYPGASRASGASTAAGSTPEGIRTQIFVRGVARALRSPDSRSRSRSRS